MEKTLVSIFTLTALFLPAIVLAHPGNTDAYGCHTCRTNCPKWGLSYNEYHCHRSKGLPQPKAPVKSSASGITVPAPDYAIPKNTYSPSTLYSPPSIPSCPLNSSYDNVSGNCKCYSGYAVQNSSCVSANSICIDRHGYAAIYNSLTNSCSCLSGHSLNSSDQCQLNKTTYYNTTIYIPTTPAATNYAIPAATPTVSAKPVQKISTKVKNLVDGGNGCMNQGLNDNDVGECFRYSLNKEKFNWETTGTDTYIQPTPKNTQQAAAVSTFAGKKIRSSVKYKYDTTKTCGDLSNNEYAECLDYAFNPQLQWQVY